MKHSISVNHKKSQRFLSAIIILIIIITSYTPQGSMTANAATANHLVISEVYGGGGNSGAKYKNDFIEIYNPTNSTINLSNWSVQYASSTGSFNNITRLSGSIGPHKFYLVKESGGTGGSISLPTADATGTINLSATSGKVALANTTISVSGANDPAVIDFVGYGSANDYETTPVPALSNIESGERKDNNGGTVESQGNGWDTDNNYADFVKTDNVNPQNSSNLAEPQSQIDSPVLSNIQPTKITSDSVIITWTTDQAASSIVNYGTNTSYGSIGFRQ
ncbi:lamin tail domain-containing protein [Ruminiclostridium cellulolyticum]|uniref:LTD domain-containing protein n=1 Tax=Ruminiclostridium cellulolyticum (strain ATCC 35319 / DSM 5812 / JCM 6584 / H10) TaxID=394503 RepID=B8I279_RUMCH|nr:lamin tail domain-containing protein [Ruminiclostridium cellulolyticum]ACL75905.1 hypothetical protein Ccel_1553 [Ruminiclostridium cellulolyticum H10]